jgi:signal transduction histidine kinase
VRLDCSDRLLQIRVSDDGRGISVGNGSGHGLETMRERAEELGGHVEIAAGNGTDVTAQIPVEAPAPDRATAAVQLLSA